MAYPTELNNQYKSEKKAGTTTAKSFPEWHKTYLVNQVVVEEFIPTPLNDDQIDLAIMKLESELMNQEEVVTDEEIEFNILNAPLTKEQVDAIITILSTVDILPEPPAVVYLSKAAHARAIFDEMYLTAVETKINMVRKDCIKRLMLEAGLTKNGAATYLQNIKSKNGLVNRK